jgi:glycosyltransferase involved in cell wall biosynthesis
VIGRAASFRQRLRAEFGDYVRQQGERFDRTSCLKLDFHCHDRNSDVPDELWGRLLGLPETWLETRDLMKCLRRNGCDAFTITNHNNARSCWELLDKGHDVLVGAEFTCTVPEYDLYLHVLTFGFTPDQEAVLNKKRKNIYEFARYAAAENVPLVLPHPLYFYTRNDKLSPELFERLALVFQRFEVLNGNRDIWQSMLVLEWARGLTQEKLERYSRKHRLDPKEFGVAIDRPKVLTGGSDDHMGLTAGSCGSYLYVADLAQRRKNTPISQLALEAIRAGNVAPYGRVVENQKLSVALLDYFSQIATRMEDPGLVRLLLHRGTTHDKLMCLAIGNILLEMKKHKRTQRFVGVMHDALHGKKPGWSVRFAVSNDYKFCVKHLEKIAIAHDDPERFPVAVNDAIAELFTKLSQLIVVRAQKCIGGSAALSMKEFSTEALIRKFEIPVQVTSLMLGDSPQRARNITGVNIAELLDKLSFPVLVNLVLAGSQIASTRVLYGNRRFLNAFAEHVGRHQHTKRALYLTDTLRDKNGVSNSLSGKLREIQRRDYPVDFLIAHDGVRPEAHLHIVKPLAQFSVPTFGEQQIRIPDLLEIARIFYRGGYDRVVCSTEGPMALVALFLKYMFNVPVYFFMHTDWLDFLRHTTNLDTHERDRIRRVMRALYHQFDGVFVLNSDHRKWLTGSQMGLSKKAVHLAAHHVERSDIGRVVPVNKSRLIPGATDATPVIFTACRISKEKGVLELPDIYRRAKGKVPGLRIVIAGCGPAEAELRAALPEATFLGWVNRERLDQIYAGLDLFVFPSKFDTFGNVVLEAFSHGMPVLTYNCKGPKDIVEHGRNGYLVDTIEEMAAQIVDHFGATSRHADMRKAALRRVEDYQAGPIMRRFMEDLGLAGMDEEAAAQPAAIAA